MIKTNSKKDSEKKAQKYWKQKYIRCFLTVKLLISVFLHIIILSFNVETITAAGMMAAAAVSSTQLINFAVSRDAMQLCCVHQTSHSDQSDTTNGLTNYQPLDPRTEATM